MSKPAQIADVFLQPGEYYFGGRATRIRTILGSCVSMTFWHPKLLLGGMSHVMLPTRGPNDKKPAELNAKYANEAFVLLQQQMQSAGTRPQDYQVKLFGGGNMFPHSRGHQEYCHIGAKNIGSVYDAMRHLGFKCHAEHIGGLGHRYIIFEIWSGHVWVRHHELLPIV